MQKNAYYKKYTDGINGFDWFLERIRFNHVKRTIEKHKHKHILDIGPGPHAGFLEVNDWDTYTNVEPVEEFCSSLVYTALGIDGVRIINATIEDSARMDA